MEIFSDAVQQKIKHYLGRYESKRSSILPILHLLQDEYGWIKPEHIEALAEQHGLSRVEVLEVATFYSMYRLEEPATYRIMFCDNVVCDMMGARAAMEKVEGKIRDYEKRTGKKAPFSLQGVPCLGVCDGAPAMLINKDRYLKVTDAKVDEILSKYDAL